MKRRLYILVAVALVIAIAFILIAPSLNLPPTALRAWYAALALFTCIALLGRILIATKAFRFVPTCFSLLDRQPFHRDIPQDRVDLLTCALRC